MRYALSSVVTLPLYYMGLLKPKTDSFLYCVFGQVKLNGLIVSYLMIKLMDKILEWAPPYTANRMINRYNPPCRA